MATWNEPPGPPAGLVRGKQGRWVGGVCVALAGVTRLSVGWIRLAFVAGALVGGLGIALYLACWLIIPEQGAGADGPAPRGPVILAQTCAALAGLGVLAAVGAVATVFGFGWVVVAVAAVVLLGALAGPRRLGPGWALLPIGALTVPALAVAAGGLRLTTQVQASALAPATASAFEHSVYRSGLNTMLVDLRLTKLPAAGTVPLHIQAGVRRTIVALPRSRCVRVVVHYDVNPFAVRLTALLTGHALVFADVVVFGRIYAGPIDTITPPATSSGPLLNIYFSSQGGSLYVRDYPDNLNPSNRPDWPGFRVHLEPRPDVRGTPRKAAQRLIDNWRARLAAQEANARMINSLMPGPCVAPAVLPPAPRRTVPRHAKRPRSHAAAPARSRARRTHR